MTRTLGVLLFVAACARPEALAQAPDHSAHQRGAAAAPAPVPVRAPVPGYAHVVLPAGIADRLDLAPTAVANRSFVRTLRAFGAVVPDETRTSHVHAKVRGWIDRVAVNFTGQQVDEGDVLCTLYSPEVYSAQLELIAMLASPSAKGPGEFVEADRQVRALTLAAARRRLTLWDVPKQEIRRLFKTRHARPTFTLHAPRAGTVVNKAALAGLYVDAATELYTVSDLSHLWVQVDLSGPDAAHVHVGDRVRLTLEGVAEPVDAPIAFLAPTVDWSTRTVQARLELDNPGGALRPGAFATAEIQVQLGEGLGIPEDAVVRTGKRNLVFVVHPTHIEPRELVLGETAGGWTQVRSGLQAGEQVATRAQFLLDSESRVRASGGGGAHAH